MVRRGFGDRLEEGRKKEIEKVECWRLGWKGRIIRGA